MAANTPTTQELIRQATEAIDRARAVEVEQGRAQGRLDAVLAQIAQEFNCQTVEELRQTIAEYEDKIRQDSEELARKMTEFDAAYRRE